jgi:hypothetical protein
MKHGQRILVLALALGVSASLSAQVHASQPRTYGTSAVSFIRVPAVEFLIFDSTYGYTEISVFSNHARYPIGCGGVGCLYAPIHLPDGAQIVSVELDAWDTDPTGFVLASLLVCDAFANNCNYHPTAGAGPADCLTVGLICSGAAYSFGTIAIPADLTGDGITVSNSTASYFVGGGISGATGATGIGSVLVGYKLQVSPAPGTSDFGDVPTSSPQFQFIEALYHSGITVGCGGGNYCPNSPLTRGQMAVFLSKALGLQWP